MDVKLSISRSHSLFWNPDKSDNMNSAKLCMHLLAMEIINKGRPVTLYDVKENFFGYMTEYKFTDYVYWLKPEALVNGHVDYEIVPGDESDVEVIIHGFETIDIQSILKEEGESE